MSNITIEHDASQAPREYRPGLADRRRPGRADNVSPELIALMRKPSSAARMRVALYDAPGFLLPPAPARRPSRLGFGRAAMAVTTCAALSAGAFPADALRLGLISGAAGRAAARPARGGPSPPASAR